SGSGETNVLQSITINFGKIEGGTAPNTIPGSAKTQCSIRLPVGVKAEDIENLVIKEVDKINDLSYTPIRIFNPNYSDIDHPIFSLMKKNAYQVLQEIPALTMRAGASDAKYFRFRNIPTINCGLTP